MTDIQIPVQGDKLEKIEGHSNSSLERAQKMEVSNGEQFQEAKEIYLMIVKSEKGGIAWMKSIVDPFKAAVKGAESQIKPLLKPYSDAKAVLKVKIEKYIREVDAREQKAAAEAREEREKENRKREEAAQIENERLAKEHEEKVAAAKAKGAEEEIEAPEEVKAELVEPTAIAKPDHSSSSERGKTHTSKIWKYRVTDFSKIPDEHKLENSKSIRDCMKDGVVIPGVEYYQESVLNARVS